MHITSIKVRGYHLDLYQHVNNARYLEFLEEARWAYFEEMQLTPLFMDAGFGMAVVNININYRYGAQMNDELEVITCFDKINHHHAIINQQIRLKHNHQPVVDAKVTFVAFDMKTQKAVSFNPPLRERLESLVVG